MDRYYPQPLLSSRTDSTTTTNYNTDTSSSTNTENDNKLFMTHYPADYAPYPINKWHNLSPYLPDVSKIDPISAKIASMIPEKAAYERERRWREIAMPQTNPDESTSFTYSSDNNLTHVDLTDGSDLDFAYDGAGRRLEKKYSTVDSGTTYETKYTYHYIGSQITTIDIDGKSISGETETVTKDDQMRIHLGANTRPISFEYYTKNLGNEQITSATYYYHYDLHGNVIRVTDSSGTTQITYTYDQLGTIVSTTNANSIYNPFTWMGEAQIIQDSEFDTSGATPKTGLYASGSSYYNPETGTSLGGSGAPAMTNPTSGSMEEPSAQTTRPAGELGAHAAIAAVAGGIPSSGVCSSGDVTPEVPYSGAISPAATSGAQQLDPVQCVGSEHVSATCDTTGKYDLMDMWWEANNRYWDIINNYERERRYKAEFDRWWGLSEAQREAERKWRDSQRPPGELGKYSVVDLSPEGAARAKVDNWNNLPDSIKNDIYGDYKNNEGSKDSRSEEQIKKWLAEKLSWVAWGYLDKDFYDPHPNGKDPVLLARAGYYLLGYQIGDKSPIFFWGPGEATWTHTFFDATARKRYDRGTSTDLGDTGPAGSWALSWNGEIATIGGLSLDGMSNVGKVKVGIMGFSTFDTASLPDKGTWDMVCLTIDGDNTSVSNPVAGGSTTFMPGKGWVIDGSDSILDAESCYVYRYNGDELSEFHLGSRIKRKAGSDVYNRIKQLLRF